MRVKKPNRDNFTIALIQSFNMNLAVSGLLVTSANSIYAACLDHSFQKASQVKPGVSSTFCICLFASVFACELISQMLFHRVIDKYPRLREALSNSRIINFSQVAILLGMAAMAFAHNGYSSQAGGES